MRIIVAGDYCERNRVSKLVKASDYDSLFHKDVRDIIRQADYSIVNFEFPIVEGDDLPIVKCGPNLSGSSQSIDAIKYAGFQCATLANNHILDYGPQALLNTEKLLEAGGVDTIGAGENLKKAGQILYKKISNKTLAIINCCEHEFSIATENTPGANPLNPVRQYYKILEARNNADYVLLIVHGGHEHWQLPSPRMVETYRYFIDCGADAVVNHHQHCYSGTEIYKDKPIIYGLGNFCFDINPIKTNDIWNSGCIAEIEFNDSSISYKLIPIKQCDEYVGVRLASYREFESQQEKLNSIINNHDLLRHETELYYSSSKESCARILNPIQNRYFLALQRRHLLPSFLSKKWLVKVQNFVLCESHRDKMEFFFNDF